MPSQSTTDPSEIARRIQALAARPEKPPPMTQILLRHLQDIENALDRGVRRRELAEAFGFQFQQFNAALAGARKLARQGGDGRRTGIRKEPIRRNSAPVITPLNADCNSLTKPFGVTK